jgi:hypothetical protein
MRNFYDPARYGEDPGRNMPGNDEQDGFIMPERIPKIQEYKHRAPENCLTS